jgi:branched-chain amino acid transport system substrate-binding protein
MVSETSKGRRDFLKVIGGTAVGLVVGGAAGYYAGQGAAPAPSQVVTTVTEMKPALSGDIPIGIIHAAPIEVGPETPAIEMALEDINNYVAQYTKTSVKFVFYEENAEESATKAVERAKTLLDRGAQILVGSEWSSHCQALLPLMNERKVVLISQSSSSPALSIPDDYLFRLQPDDTQESLCVKRQTLDLGIKAVICVYAKEAYGEGLYKQMVPKWTDSGVEIVQALGIDPQKKEFIAEFGTVDDNYKAALKKYKAEEIGIFMFGTYGPDIPALTSLAKYPDLLNARVFDSDNGGAPGYVQYAGDIAAQVQFTAFAFGPSAHPKFQAWVQRYKDKAGFEPYFTSYSIYDCLWLAALSTLQAQTYSGPEIKAILPSIASSYFGATGWTELNENGDRKYPTYNIYRIVKEGGQAEWKTIGFYDGVTDTITWFKS